MIRKWSPGGRRPAQQYPINVYGYLVGMWKSWNQALPCGIHWQDKKQWVQTETQEIQFKIGNSFFLVRVVEHCHRSPREVVETLVSEIFKTQLYAVCGSLLWASRDLDWITSKEPFLLNCPVIMNTSPKAGQSFTIKASKQNKPTVLLLGCKMSLAMFF